MNLKVRHKIFCFSEIKLYEYLNNDLKSSYKDLFCAGLNRASKQHVRQNRSQIAPHRFDHRRRRINSQRIPTTAREKKQRAKFVQLRQQRSTSQTSRIALGGLFRWSLVVVLFFQSSYLTNYAQKPCSRVEFESGSA